MMKRLSWLFVIAIAPVGAFVGKSASFLPRRSLSATAADIEGEHVFIDYCNGCRWMLRSAWMAQELLTTFQDELDSVTLVPSRPPAPGGIFRVRRNDEVLWDRKEDGGFPESKELKQRIRDRIAPEKFLGHSDTAERQDNGEGDVLKDDNPTNSATAMTGLSSIYVSQPNVAITYCTGCRWLLRAAWLGQELLTTFDEEIDSVTLIPSRPPAKGGTFTVVLDGELLWDRAEKGRFPEPKEVKQLIRDIVSPSRDLGHSDVKNESNDDEYDGFGEMDDDEAEEMRKYFGVM